LGLKISVNIMLSGLISQWTYPREWKSFTDFSSSKPTFRAWTGERAPVSWTNDLIVLPSSSCTTNLNSWPRGDDVKSSQLFPLPWSLLGEAIKQTEGFHQSNFFFELLFWLILYNFYGENSLGFLLQEMAYVHFAVRATSYFSTDKLVLFILNALQ
jgi:hypothetical protein